MAELAPSEAAAEGDDNSEPSFQRRVVYDFVANRALAHRFVGEVWVLEARKGHFEKYVPFGGGRWRHEVVENRHVIRLVSRRAALRIPERARIAKGDRIGLQLFAARRGTVVIRSSDGKRLASLKLAAGWQELELELNEGPGRSLVLEASRSLKFSLERLTLAAGKPDVSVGDVARASGAVVLSAGETHSYYVTLPEGAELGGRASAGCAVVATVHGGGVGQATLPALPARFERSGPVRIDVGLKDCATGEIEELTMTVESRAAQPPPQAPPPKNLILWVMDTLRADRVRPINPKARAEVPGLERLAKRGVVFRNAWVEGNESKASHASIWTSRFPAVHNVRTAGRPGEWRIGNQFETLGELVKGTGKRVVGLTANGMVTAKAGYARGFDQFENPMRDGTGKRRNGYIPSERLWERTTQLIEPLNDEPFFFFLGTIDTHKPWVGHQPWLDRYDTDYRGPFAKAAYPRQLGMKKGSMQCTVVPKPRDLERINAIYDSAISYQDDHLGKLLDWLEQTGVLDETLIIVTADHGEELWEVGRCGHGASLRETLVHVPLLISYPGRLPSAVAIDDGVDGVDILPTILELLEAPIPSGLQGRSLVSLARSGDGYPSASYASQYEYAHAMRIGAWKIRVGGSVELYDLNADSGEFSNLAGTTRAGIAEQQLADALQLFLRNRKRWRKAQWGAPNNLSLAGAAAVEK